MPFNSRRWKAFGTIRVNVFHQAIVYSQQRGEMEDNDQQRYSGEIMKRCRYVNPKCHKSTVISIVCRWKAPDVMTPPPSTCENSSSRPPLQHPAQFNVPMTKHFTCEVPVTIFRAASLILLWVSSSSLVHAVCCAPASPVSVKLKKQNKTLTS